MTNRAQIVQQNLITIDASPLQPCLPKKFRKASAGNSALSSKGIFGKSVPEMSACRYPILTGRILICRARGKNEGPPKFWELARGKKHHMELGAAVAV